MTTVEKRQEIERKIVHHLIRTAKAYGWHVGGDEMEPCGTESEAMDFVFGVCESTIYFKKAGNKRAVVIVLGNDGYDCISDHSVSKDDSDGWNKAMANVDAYCEKLEVAS